MKMKWTFLLCAYCMAQSTHPTNAQPEARAEVTPQPAEAVKKPRVPKAGRADANGAKRDERQIAEFETLFGRKLTAEQLTQLSKAAAERDEAVVAAQKAYQAQFEKITGVSQREFRAQRQKARLQNNPADGAGAAAKPPRAGKGKTHPGNLPDGTPADAPVVMPGEAITAKTTNQPPTKN